MKLKLLHLLILVFVLLGMEALHSQTFPNINNDTTYLRRITEEEGSVQEYPIYIDTINMGQFTKHALYDMRNQERFYSNFALIVNFKKKYFLNNDSILVYNTNLSTNNLQLASILDSVSLNFSHYKLLDMHFSDSIYKGLTFILQFDSIVNLMGVYEFFQDTSIVNYLTLFNLPIEYLSIEDDRSLLCEKIDSSLILPNPVKDILTLDIKNENIKNFQYEIFDISGNKVLEGTLFNSQNINVSHLSKGIYILKINSQSQKFIKE